MKRLLFGAFVFALFNLQIVLAQGATTEDLLPRVLIIGDSISIGYVPYVSQMMKRDAVVKHNQGNAQHTETGLKNINQWLGDTNYKIIAAQVADSIRSALNEGM